ncbi:MAG: YiiX/YebB-like N1pC/P60 family cysteine hydrolase [Hyphomicrobiales bacterium]
MSETGKDTIFDRIGRFVAKGLNMEKSGYVPFTPSDLRTMRAILRPGDIVLVEGNRQVSSAIKYLTQSTWSHAAMYVGDSVSVPIDQNNDPEDRPCLVEVNLGEGCVAVPLSKYETYNTRICRPVSLSDEDTEKVIHYAISRLGTQYDHSNIFDMLRYFFPIPFPAPIRRRMISLGSGDPSRAICSTLIAQAFQEVGYPVLPVFDDIESKDCAKGHCQSEVMHIRHHSLFAPRDFDLSPYFEVVKPTLVKGFDYKNIVWSGEVASIDPLNKRHTRKAAEEAAEEKQNAAP